jgi:hypothetical protein
VTFCGGPVPPLKRPGSEIVGAATADVTARWLQADPLLLLLVAGHLLGDFLFQSRRMAEGKHRHPPLLGHVVAVTGVHLVVLLPYLSRPVLLAVLAIGGSHWLIDLLKARWRWERPGPLGLFLADQVAHLLVLAAAFTALVHFASPLPLHMTDEATRAVALAALTVGVFAFNWTGGAAVVSAVLSRLSPTLEHDEDQTSGVAGSGRLIGVLERTITLILILAGQWAAIMLLLTAKSIARFEELKQRRFAEYFLVGTLVSLLLAVVSGLALRVLLFGGPLGR